MRRLPPRATRIDPLFPYTTLFRSQAVPAGADNHDVIFGFRLGIRPLLLPALVAAHRLAKERSPGELRHGYTPEFMSVGSIGLPACAGQNRNVKLTSCLRHIASAWGAIRACAQILDRPGRGCRRSEERRVGKEGDSRCSIQG